VAHGGFRAVWCMCENGPFQGEAGELLTDDLQVDQEDLCARLSGLQGHKARSYERWGPGLSWVEYNRKTRRRVLTCQRTRVSWALRIWRVVASLLQNTKLLERWWWGLLWAAAVCVRFSRSLGNAHPSLLKAKVINSKTQRALALLFTPLYP
jgi:hypothetical protein